MCMHNSVAARWGRQWAYSAFIVNTVEIMWFAKFHSSFKLLHSLLGDTLCCVFDSLYTLILGTFLFKVLFQLIL